eukprot:TRINITY_DN15130_c0_g1_i1.p1 TRINITY_DN15130_c0_g1~~TRINITY_DN15130_c0_g1_i1.p1  ORF type:complete len:103 (+),score=2.12 TRINITY_DN15130_c0_g1_i1:3-311(+)
MFFKPEAAFELGLVFFFKQKTAYEIGLGIPAEPLFRSKAGAVITAARPYICPPLHCPPQNCVSACRCTGWCLTVPGPAAGAYCPTCPFRPPHRRYARGGMAN